MSEDDPDNWPVHIAMRDAFRDKAQERIKAQKEARRGRRRELVIRGGLTTIAAVLLGGGAAVGIGAYIADQGDGVRGDAGAPGRVLPREPSDRVLARWTTADPNGGPRWGLSTYTSQKDQSCVLAARVVKGHMGIVRNGTFTGFRKGVPGFCDDLSHKHLMFTVRRYALANGGRTLIYGQADREVQRLVLDRPQGAQAVRLFSDGTFLLVFVGEDALRGARLTATINGERQGYQLG